MTQHYLGGPWIVSVDNGPDGPHGAASAGIWSAHAFDAGLRQGLGEEEARNRAWLSGYWGEITNEALANLHLQASAVTLLETLQAVLAAPLPADLADRVQRVIEAATTPVTRSRL